MDLFEAAAVARGELKLVEIPLDPHLAGLGTALSWLVINLSIPIKISSDD